MDLMKQVNKDLKIVKDEMAYIAVLRMQGATLKNASKLEDFFEWKRFCTAEDFLRYCVFSLLSEIEKDYYEDDAKAFNYIQADWKRNGQNLCNDIRAVINLLHSNPDIDPDKKVENLLKDLMNYIEDNILDIKWCVTIMNK